MAGQDLIFRTLKKKPRLQAGVGTLPASGCLIYVVGEGSCTIVSTDGLNFIFSNSLNVPCEIPIMCELFLIKVMCLSDMFYPFSNRIHSPFPSIYKKRPRLNHRSHS